MTYLSKAKGGISQKKGKTMARLETHRLTEKERKMANWHEANVKALRSGVAAKQVPWNVLRDAIVDSNDFEHGLIQLYNFDLDEVDYVEVDSTLGVIYSEDF